MLSSIARRVYLGSFAFSTSAEISFLDMVKQYYDHAGVLAGIPKDRMEFLRSPDYSLKFNIPFRTDSGLIEVVEAYRCQHKTHKLPTKGGTRFADNINLEQVEALATLMTIKNTIAGLPYGGAKGGVKIDPRSYSQTQLARVTRNYARALMKKKSLSPAVDVPGPDIGTSGREMTIIMDEYQSIYGERDINYSGITTGKSIQHHGIRGREESTGLGVFYATRQILNNQDWVEKLKVTKGLQGKKIIIQGYGNVGYWASKFFVEQGAIFAGVAQVDGSFFCPSGVDPDSLMAYKKERRGIKGFLSYANKQGHEYINDEAIYQQCDIFIPAAFEQAINVRNADKFNCRLIVQAANGPTTKKGEEILLKKGVNFLPDVLCNGGGVTVSYFQWLKNIDHVSWGRMMRKWQQKVKNNFLEVIQKALQLDATKVQQASKFLLQGAKEKDIVYAGLQEVMSTATNEVLETATQKGLDLRTAAFVLALTRINDHFNVRGIDI